MGVEGTPVAYRLDFLPLGTSTAQIQRTQNMRQTQRSYPTPVGDENHSQANALLWALWDTVTW